jgi:1-acyl-sn-glycerol-3-phosphate acyltransferase
MEWLLTREGTGNALALIVGGAVEALDAVPGKLEVTLSPRMGFVKMALKHGAHLVPVISFGENEVLDQKERDENAWVKKFQKKMTQILGFSPPFFHGRGVFQYTVGLLPYRKPIITVVGNPIEVKQTSDPTKEQVAALHEQYTKSLLNLFNEYKDKYGSEGLTMVIK